MHNIDWNKENYDRTNKDIVERGENNLIDIKWKLEDLSNNIKEINSMMEKIDSRVFDINLAISETTTTNIGFWDSENDETYMLTCHDLPKVGDRIEFFNQLWEIKHHHFCKVVDIETINGVKKTSAPLYGSERNRNSQGNLIFLRG
jgi:hypothetical protein